jgi:hypothetical protein
MVIVVNGNEFNEKYSYHNSDSTSYIGLNYTGDVQDFYPTDSTSNIGFSYGLDSSGNVAVTYPSGSTKEDLPLNSAQYSGFNNLDEGGIFDAPFASEIVQIQVINLAS